MEQKLKYHKLVDDLKEQILSNNIQVGDKLPSENTLSENYKVSRQTVRKALSILEKEGYIYAEHGRGTFCSEIVRHSGKSKNIAVITTYLTDYIFPRVIQGIDSELTKQGYSIILKNTRNSRSQESKCLEELLQKDIEGIIIEPSKSHIYCKHLGLYEKLETYKIPYVFIQGIYTQLQDKPQVLLNDCKGGYLITKYLIEQGHKKIAGIFKSDDIQGQNRHKGYVQALQEAGMKYDPDNVIWFYTEDRVIHPYESMKLLIQRTPEIDAVVCYNDQVAIKVIHALQETGKHVPEDISVTGYDNSYIANNGFLKLTTISHPQEKLGEMAADLLMRLIQNKEEETENTKILIEPEVIIGESCQQRR